MKSPAFQFYAHDFLGGTVATYSIEEVGAYSLLLAFDWSLTGLPTEPEKLARLLRVSRRKFDTLWATIGEQFVEHDGRYFNPRLEMEREKQRAWREKSAKGGRNHGKKGGSTVVEADGQPNGSTPSPTPSPTPVTARTSTRTAARAPRADGGPPFNLAPYIDTYTGRFGDGQVPAARFGRTLKALERKHGHDETLRRWRIFVPLKGELGPEYFGRTWNEWGAAPPTREALRVVPDPADEAWRHVLSLVPTWHRREFTAESFAALPPGVRRGLSAIGGLRKLAETPDDKRVWLKKEFAAAFAQTPSHAGAA